VNAVPGLFQPSSVGSRSFSRILFKKESCQPGKKKKNTTESQSMHNKVRSEKRKKKRRKKRTEQILDELLVGRNGLGIPKDGDEGGRLAHDEGLAELGQRVSRVRRLARLHAGDDGRGAALDVDGVSDIVRERLVEGLLVEDVGVSEEGVDSAVRWGDFYVMISDVLFR